MATPNVLKVSWPQVHAWRLRRQLLEPIGTEPIERVVGRLGAVQAQADAAAELSVRVRRQRSRPGEVAEAVADGRIIKVWAMRGAVHLMTPDDGAAYMALRASSRMWELPSWQSYYGVNPDDWDAIRSTVREALSRGPLTRSELGAAVTSVPRFQHLGFAFAEGAGTFLKPLCWQGVMSFGPPRDGRSTFMSLDKNPRWRGRRDLDDAGRRAVESYYRAYGPATPAHLHYWLAEGLGAGRRRVQGWIAALVERLADVEVDGEPAQMLREDLDALAGAAAASPTVVRLLPAYDQWVLGPGTADPHVVPPARRTLVSRQAAIVIAGGVVSGTWSTSSDQLVVEWFPEAGRPPREALATEVERLAAILEQPLRLDLRDAAAAAGH